MPRFWPSSPPPRMESLEEFDNEYPLSISYCERISPQDFEKQALSYTHKSLQDLFLQMEQNPRICEKLLRRKKQEEAEEAGLLQYLKAKIFSMLQGDLNYANELGEMEMAEKVMQLKQEMEKASSYAHAARSVVRWPLETRAWRNVPLGGFSPSQTHLPDLGMPKVFGSFSKQQMERSVASNPDLKHLWTGVASVNQKSMVDLSPLMLNPSGFRPSFLGSGSLTRMKYSNAARTLASHPAPSSQNEGSSSASVAFNTPVLTNVRGNPGDERENEKPGPGSRPAGA
ncbi:hypothetical protein lerEdw1_019379 [Lerista edwardsae]|nr:hypothetical protein lerEdw1_019379 [Lerista edwardsae]